MQGVVDVDGSIKSPIKRRVYYNDVSKMGEKRREADRQLSSLAQPSMLNNVSSPKSDFFFFLQQIEIVQLYDNIY
jgi:hypothetical protein